MEKKTVESVTEAFAEQSFLHHASNSTHRSGVTNTGSLVCFDKTTHETIFCQKAHDYEAWYTSFHPNDPNLVFSAADDCAFKAFDLRSKSQIWQNKKHHTAGVTYVEVIADNYLLTGSYDQSCAVWDTRAMKCPV